jgi:hypothetical protein
MTWREWARATSSDSRVPRFQRKLVVKAPTLRYAVNDDYQNDTRTQQQKQRTTQLLHSNKSLEDDEESDVWTMSKGQMQQQQRSAKVSAKKRMTTINQKLCVNNKLSRQYDTMFVIDSSVLFD